MPEKNNPIVTKKMAGSGFGLILAFSGLALLLNGYPAEGAALLVLGAIIALFVQKTM